MSYVIEVEGLPMPDHMYDSRKEAEDNATEAALSYCGEDEEWDDPSTDGEVHLAVGIVDVTDFGPVTVDEMWVRVFREPAKHYHKREPWYELFAEITEE